MFAKRDSLRNCLHIDAKQKIDDKLHTDSGGGWAHKIPLPCNRLEYRHAAIKNAAVASSKQHRLYGKTLRRTTRYKAHDPNNVCKLGDTVRLVETRPISKEKRWRVAEILVKGEAVEGAQQT